MAGSGGLNLAIWRLRLAGHRFAYAFLRRWDRIVTWRRASRRVHPVPALRWAEARDLLPGLLASPVLSELRASLSADLEGHRCVVIGSAPNTRLPRAQQGDRHFCVNGSLHIATQLGIEKPAVHLLNAYSLYMSAERAGSRELLRGLSTAHLLLLDPGVERERALEAVAEIDLHYDRLDCISRMERVAIILQATGLHLGLGRRHQYLSTGMSAVAMALWAGASEVVLAGFSMAGGHQYLQVVTNRDHVVGDSLFLAAMGRTGLVKTTNPALASAFDLPLVEAA
jgi:hypothetical protein